MKFNSKCMLWASILVVVSSAKLPSTFLKCNKKNPDFKQCVLKAATQGLQQLKSPLRELKLPNINPFEVTELTVGGNGAVAVDQKFRDCKLSGFHEGTFHNFEFDFEGKVLHLNITFPDVKKLCQYELDGRILVLPIKGKGPSTIILKNLNVVASMPWEEVKRKGKTYIHLTDFKMKLSPELVTFNFENLLSEGGNEELGKNVNHVLNENWKEIFQEVEEGYAKVIGAIVVQVYNEFFTRVSMEEAFD